jgi:hypothetical protein
MRGHDDEAQDRKMFGKMLKKALPHKKTSTHHPKGEPQYKAEPKDALDTPKLSKKEVKKGVRLDTKKTKYAKVLP